MPPSASAKGIGTDRSVRVSLRYLIPAASKPVYHVSEGGAGARVRIENATFDDREVSVRDARTLPQPASLDSQGFTLTEHSTTVTDFHQESALAGYEAEIRFLVLAATGAESAFIFDHTRRSNSPHVREQHRIRETATVIHNDYTDYSARKRLRELLPAEAEVRLRKRFAIVNVWRTIAGPVLSKPLACCDAQTLDASDLIAGPGSAQVSWSLCVTAIAIAGSITPRCSAMKSC